MQKNEGHADRVSRIVLGLVVVGLGVYFQNWLGAIGLVPLATGTLGYCPLYQIFGFSTCPLKAKG